MAITSAPHQHKQARNGRLLLIAVLASVLVLAVIATALLVRGDGGTGSSGSTQGSGIAATQTRAVTPFSSLDLAGSNIVTVTVGAPQSVVVHADSNLIGDVTTRVAAGTLIVSDTGNFTTRSPMSVQVTVPALTELQLSGSGQINVTGITASRLTVTLSGSGVLSVTGTVAQLYVTLGGTGQAQLGRLIARDVHAVVSGSGVIQLTATSSLDAAVPGTGAIVYDGNPARVTTSVTGSGTVTPG